MLALLRSILLIWLIPRLLKLIPIIFISFLYLLCCSYVLCTLNYGLAHFWQNNGIFDSPIIMLTYLVNYTVWAIINASHSGIFSPLLISAGSFLLPLAILKFFSNLYYFIKLIAVYPMKQWTLGALLHPKRTLCGKKQLISPSGQQTVIAKPQVNNMNEMKQIASSVRFARVNSEQVDSLKQQSMQREEPGKKVLGVGLKE